MILEGADRLRRPAPGARLPSAAVSLKGRRLVVVAGKGGVGRSTVAAALALAASRQGRRTIVCEVAGRCDVPALLGDGHDDRRQRPRLSDVDHLSIDRTSALDEYLRAEIPGPLAGAILARSHAFQLFVDAAPGLSELLTIGKVWQLTQPRWGGEPSHDLVVLDGPASGQLLGLLGAPRTFRTIARAGPVAAQTAGIEQFLHDPAATAVITVVIPEQMAVTEALELHAALVKQFGIAPAAVVVNRILRCPVPTRDLDALAMAGEDPAVRSARWLYARVRSQRAHIARLRKGLAGEPVLRLPFVFADEFGPPEVLRLATLLQPLWS